MGQQQLLLVILVTIIVGIATVVAINTFSSAADSANVDAVRNDLASIAASSQGYYMRPEMLGGGQQSFEDITFNDITFAASDTSSTGAATTVANENGTYTISTDTQASFVVSAVPATAGGSIVALICADGMALSDYAETGTATTPSSCD